MTIMPFDAIRRLMDAQLVDFTVRRAAAERDDAQRCAEFGDVVNSPSVTVATYECAAGEACEQQPFLRRASEPGGSSVPCSAATLPEDYREAPWLRRASD